MVSKGMGRAWMHWEDGYRMQGKVGLTQVTVSA